MGIVVVENEEELVKNLVNLIEEVSQQVIEGNGIFKIGVSGNTPVYIFTLVRNKLLCNYNRGLSN